MKNIIAYFLVIFSFQVQAQSADTTITLKVKGITCKTDLTMIQTSVEKLEGVKEVVSGFTGGDKVNPSYEEGQWFPIAIQVVDDGQAKREVRLL